jgi:hypothetical protein
MLGAIVRRVRRRLMVPERVEPPKALGARDIVGPEALFRAQFAMRSLLLCTGLGGGDGWAYESTRFS